MKKLILTSLFAGAVFAAQAANYTLINGTDVDILVPENWNAASITDADTLYITSAGTSAVMGGNNNTLTFNHMNVYGNVSLTVSGSGNSLVGAGTSNSNVNIGTSANNSTTVSILGYGNSFSDKSGWSLMMGNINSTSGESVVRIHSSLQNVVDGDNNVLVDNSNKFTIPSSVNSFIKLSVNENSTARNAISLGDNSIADFQTNFYLGANDSTTSAIKGGTAEVVFDGQNSELKIKNSAIIGANNGGQEGGVARIVVGGSGNRVSTTSNLAIGAGGGYSEGLAQSGGNNGVYFSGANNSYYSTQSISVASQYDMSNGVNEFIVSGSGNNVEFANLNVGRQNSSAVFSGGKNSFEITGKNNVITARNSINVYADKQSGGEALFEIGGSGNEVYFSANNTVGGAMSGGSARWVLGGENNSAEYVNVMSFNVGRTAMTGGEAALEIRGKNNTAKFFNVFIGNADTTNGKAKIIVEGSGHTININSQLMPYFSGALGADGKKSGGGFEFIADADGVSTLNINNFNAVFKGLIEMDFSKYIVKDEINGDEFTLISVNSNAGNLLTSDLMADIDHECAVNEYFKVSGTDEFEIFFGDKTVNIRVFSTYIPEPSTYAAMAGLLALAFALYRRRK